jgi:hypothetical protein
MATMQEEKKTDDHPSLHLTSKLDSRFSLNSENSEDEDAVHKAVGGESWYQVSL